MLERRKKRVRRRTAATARPSTFGRFAECSSGGGCLVARRRRCAALLVLFQALVARFYHTWHKLPTTCLILLVTASFDFFCINPSPFVTVASPWRRRA